MRHDPGLPPFTGRPLVVVTVKPVPDPAETGRVRVDPHRLTVDRAGVPLVPNAADRHALGLALRLRAGWPWAGPPPEIVALAMAPPQAQDALRQVLAMGADRAVLLSDPAFAGADTLATARCLALGVRHLGPGAALLIAGEKSSDAGTGQVGPQLATLLDLPWVPGVTSAVWEGSALLVSSVGGSWRITLPALVVAASEAAPPAAVSFTGVVGARNRLLIVLGAAHLGPAEASGSGRPPNESDGAPPGRPWSPTRTLGWSPAEAVPRGRVLQGSLAEVAAELAGLLRSRVAALAAGGPGTRTSDGTETGASVPSPALPPTLSLVDARPRTDGAVLVVTGLGSPQAVTTLSEAAGPLAGEDDTPGVILARRAGRRLFHLALGEELGSDAWCHPVGAPARLAAVLRVLSPWAVVVPAARVASRLAAATAALLGTGLVGGAVGLEAADGSPAGKVPAFGGYALVGCPEARPAMFTITANPWPGGAAGPASGTWRLDLGGLPGPAGEPGGRLERRGRGPGYPGGEPAGAALTEARVVVVGGAGIASRDGWPLVERLAAALGGAVGATRPVVDAGLAPEDRMVGHSGLTINPDVYVGVGVSGDVQHTTGLGKVGFMVAVNRDPSCRLVRLADAAVVADAREFVPLLLDRLERGR